MNIEQEPKKISTRTITKGFLWKLLERLGVQGTQFLLQIFLARLLTPEDYGVLAMLLIFITLSNVFIQAGFNTALIQNKEVTEDDYSSVFWISLTIAVFLYIIIFFSAPAIADFYKMPDIITPLRVLALVLIPGAFNSIQLAKVNRVLDFKKVFYSNLLGIILSGIVGIILALMGWGLWSLVGQYLLNIVFACIIMFFSIRWVPRFIFNIKRIRVLFSFGWKLLVSSLLDTLYSNIRSLVVGKRYDSGTLGFYNRGRHFPIFIIYAVNSAVQSVMLPAMSSEQDDKDRVKAMARRSITLSSYIIFPMMAGLAGIAIPLVSLLLTDKWLPCVPYLQIYCFTLAFYPVHSCNLQAINAMGRSDIFLKLEIIKKLIGMTALIIAVVYFDTPIAIAMTGMFTVFISCFINAYPNKKLIGYSYFEQMRDILPSFLCAITMFIAVFLIGKLPLHNIVLLPLQVVSGTVIYLALSIFFKLEIFEYLLKFIKGFIGKA